jgi:hypothetical protein
MHPFHSDMLFNLENDRIAVESEAYFQNLRDAGIEPAPSRRSMVGWLGRSRAPRHRPRPA